MEKDICIMILFRGIDKVSQETGISVCKLNSFLRNHIMLIEQTISALLKVIQPILGEHSVSDLSEYLEISENCVESLIQGRSLDDTQKEKILTKSLESIDQSTATDLDFSVEDKESQTENLETVEKHMANAPELPMRRTSAQDVCDKQTRKQRNTDLGIVKLPIASEQQNKEQHTQLKNSVFNIRNLPYLPTLYDIGRLGSALNKNHSMNNLPTNFLNAALARDPPHLANTNLNHSPNGTSSTDLHQSRQPHVPRPKNAFDPVASIRQQYMFHMPVRGDYLNPDYSMFP